ncbi:ROK family protein [Frankia sp. Mgl5]|uniref:ROK family protein n=1 Tax=Frankia sp. Mgl5 TaxID=2933793 RepID=UPI00200C9F1D|nr:ROK family protein [Frankia sp. Mgl5]
MQRAPNLGWSDLRPAELLDDSVLAGLPLAVGNEANLAAQQAAQSAPGRPSALSDFLYLSGEIGIGGAAVRAGQVMMGRHGWAGEIGHVCVDPAGPICRCGSTGCLEQYAGRHALTAAAGLETTAPPEQLLGLVTAGDPTARRAVTAAAQALSVALAGIINVLDIPTVVLGGYLGQIAPLLRPDLEDLLQARVISARWSTPTVQAATYSPAPGATGAAFRELTAVIEHPARWFHPTAAAGNADVSTGVSITRS